MQRILGISVMTIGLVACATTHETGIAKQAVVPKSMAETYEQFQYAPAMRAGDFLFLSGVVASTQDADQGDFLPGIRRAFDEIELILAEADASWKDVVDVTSYMTDLDQQIGPLWQVKGERVPAPFPAWTAIGVQRLYGGDAAIIEIKVTAYKPR